MGPARKSQSDLEASAAVPVAASLATGRFGDTGRVTQEAPVKLVGCGAGNDCLRGGQVFAVSRPHTGGAACGGHDRVDLHAGPDLHAVGGDELGEGLGEPAAAADRAGSPARRVTINSTDHGAPPASCGPSPRCSNHGNHVMTSSSLANRSPSRSSPDALRRVANGQFRSPPSARRGEKRQC
jgi:hypothetical protein